MFYFHENYDSKKQTKTATANCRAKYIGLKRQSVCEKNPV